ADAYRVDSKYSEAETAYQKTLSITERIAPTSYVQGYAFLGLGQVYMYQGKYADADQPLQRATRIFEQAVRFQPSGNRNNPGDACMQRVIPGTRFRCTATVR